MLIAIFDDRKKDRDELVGIISSWAKEKGHADIILLMNIHCLIEIIVSMTSLLEPSGYGSRWAASFPYFFK